MSSAGGRSIFFLYTLYVVCMYVCIYVCMYVCMFHSNSMKSHPILAYDGSMDSLLTPDGHRLYITQIAFVGFPQSVQMCEKVRDYSKILNKTFHVNTWL